MLSISICRPDHFERHTEVPELVRPSWESASSWESDSLRAACICPNVVNSAWVSKCLAPRITPILIRAKVPGSPLTSSSASCRTITCRTGLSNLGDALTKFHRNLLQFEGYRVSWGNCGWISLISQICIRSDLYSLPAPCL